MKVQDIRSFFNNKNKTGSGNSNDRLVPPSPEVVEVPSRLRKGTKSKKEGKGKSQDNEDAAASLSDEDPLPKPSSSKKSERKKKVTKTKPLPCSDESDGEEPLPKSVRNKKTNSSEGRKRKAKVLADSDDEDADFDLKKSTSSVSKSKAHAAIAEKTVTKKVEDKKEKKPKVNVNPEDFFSSEPVKRHKKEPSISNDSTANEDKRPTRQSPRKSVSSIENSKASTPPSTPSKRSSTQESSEKSKRVSSRTPTRGESSRTPTKGESSRTPTKGESSRTPTRGESSRTPTRGESKQDIEKSASKLSSESSPSKKSESKDSTKTMTKSAVEKSEVKPTKSPQKEAFKAPTPKAKDKSKEGRGNKRPPKKVETDDDDEDNFDPKAKPPPAKKVSVSPSKKEDDAVPTVKTPDEKKKVQQQNYAKYLAKVNAKPKNLGKKEIPIGAPDCLANMTFVITGVLDSLERDDCKSIAEQYGGRVTGSVSKKTTYLIVGDDPGESKTRKATQLNVPHITEDEFLDILRKSNPNQESASEETMDFEEEEDESEQNKSVFESSNVITEKIKSVSPKKGKKSPKKAVKKVETVVKEEKKVEPTTSSKTSASAGSDSTGLMWVDKYKPKSLKQVVGQLKDTSNASKLVRWLRNWFNYHGSSEDKAKSAYPGLKDPEGKTFKCALLSGPPGIGKTTTAHLACKEVGYDFFELNASDTRNKNGLKANVADALTSKCLFRGVNNNELTRKHVLIMDEVDGMSGNEDRGGVQELISLIKSSRVPIICICNDRNHQKIRSLSNYCFDLRFSKPTIQELKGFISSICFKEKIKVDPQKVTQLMISTDQDIRQILHQLELYKDGTADRVLDPKKDLRFGPWDVCRKVFSKVEHGPMNIHEKTGLFFQDYSFGPLFVQENYLKQNPARANGNKYKKLDLIYKSAASIADGDLVDNIIRRTNNWAMLPVQAIFSSYVPGEYMESNTIGAIDFPQWLGKNSNKNKRHRLLQALHTHVHLQVSGSLEALNMDYLPYLRRSIVNPLANSDYEVAAKKMEMYALIRDDLESINELSLWPGMKNPMDRVDTKTKSAFTRLVNKEILPYSNAKPVKAKGRAKADELEGMDGDEELEQEEEEEDESLEKDAMIKMKARKTSSATSGRGKGKKGDDLDEARPSTSKASKGKGSRSKK